MSAIEADPPAGVTPAGRLSAPAGSFLRSEFGSWPLRPVSLRDSPHG